MDRKKAIEEMAIKMGRCHFDSCVECRRQANCPHCFIFEQARILGENGYGNIEEALTEFAESVKKKAFFQEMTIFTDDEWITVEDYVSKIVDETLKEFLMQ